MRSIGAHDVTDRYRSPDDLVLPFIFIPHGAPESPEVAAFKARYPGWFTIPATFVPRAAGSVRDNAGPLPDGSAATGHSRAASQAAPPRMPERTDTASAFRAFQRANALHGDPVAALRALRDTPDKFADGAQALPMAQSFALPWLMPPPLGGVGGDIDEAGRELSNAITRIFRNENQGEEPPQAQPDAPGDKHASTPTGQRGDPVTIPRNKSANRDRRATLQRSRFGSDAGSRRTSFSGGGGDCQWADQPWKPTWHNGSRREKWCFRRDRITRTGYSRNQQVTHT
jgi:hypothetical protein